MNLALVIEERSPILFALYKIFYVKHQIINYWISLFV